MPNITIKGNIGKVIYILNKGPYIICKDKAILIDEYYVEGEEKVKLPNGINIFQ